MVSLLETYDSKFEKQRSKIAKHVVKLKDVKPFSI